MEIKDDISRIEKYLGTEMKLEDYIETLKHDLCIPKSLKELGLPSSSVEEMAEKVMGIKRLLSVNPVDITLKDAVNIYNEAYYA